MIGDESALPAITAALTDLTDDAVVRVIVTVDSAAHEPELKLGHQGQVVFIHRSAGNGESAEAAVRALEWLPGRVDAFVHGEAHEVMHGIRPYLFKVRGVPKGQVSISGYWRKGRSEESFREWKSELAAVEGDGRGGGRKGDR